MNSSLALSWFLLSRAERPSYLRLTPCFLYTRVRIYPVTRSQMLHAHLKLVPEDFFDVELSKDNFLVSCLSALVQVRIASASPYWW